MRFPRRTMPFALALFLAAPVGASLAAEKAKAAPDQDAAIALAEKASLPLIGADQMASARPFKATQHGDIWLVISQPVPDPKNPAAAKRAVVVQLDQNTGEILDIDTAQ
jgi:hypothetical protein